MLKIGKDISFPDQAITETFGILAARGAGKSNTAAVMAEEMFEAGLPFVAIDPVGSWWGLRSSGSGKSGGIPIAIFGGRHGDIPLERTSGKLVANLVVERRLSCVLDLTQFDSEAAKKQFLLDFARQLYLKNELPLHLFLEEADDYIPQRPMRDEAQLLRAWENIVRRGRSRGLGMTMITQRSASINKNVLTQVQTLIAMRTTGPQDRKAIEEWVKYNDASKDILGTLSGLSDGEAWIWSPQFLKDTRRVKFRRRRTFDSGSTPKIAAKGKTATIADINVSQIREQMTDVIEKAEQN
ncbi:MAG: helicase HerA-like domain-containing protein, partial [Pseudomonadota bacterium]